MDNFWEKMLGKIVPSRKERQFEDTELLSKIDEVLQDISETLSVSDRYIDPEIINQKIIEYGDIYFASQKRRNAFRFFDLKMKNKSQSLIEAYESFTEDAVELNRQYIGKKIYKAKELILPVEGHDLDDQQMRAIVKNVHNHLIIAGAGTGKTTTVLGYVKYLLLSEMCTADEILVLSFTNASASEMNERLQKELNMDVETSTFHKLAMNIVNDVEGVKPTIYSKDLRKYVRDTLDSYLNNKNYLSKFIDYQIRYGGNQREKADFNSKEEYEEHLKSNPPTTLNGEIVKSYGEIDIANFLMRNGINYEYESIYEVDTSDNNHGQYRPDFYLPDYKIYIEYFGIDRDGNVADWFDADRDGSASEKYREGIEWKRMIHKENHTQMIELFSYERQEMSLLDKLEEELHDRNVVFHPLTYVELFDKLSGNRNEFLDAVGTLYATVINLTKSNNISLDQLRERNNSFKKRRSIDSLIDLIEPIYVDYNNMLLSTRQIDFNDMINKATRYVSQGQYKHNYKFVIIDEYQDISQSRFRLLEELRKVKDYQVFCVGDDWQSIYRFSGSDIGFILNFEKYWGKSATDRIETTYRFTNSLIDISTSFIRRNPEQFSKLLRSMNPNDSFSAGKVQIFNNKNTAEYIAQRLKELPKNSSVFMLGRYRFDSNIFENNSKFRRHYDIGSGKVMIDYIERRDLHIEFLTIHSSKGLQADYVFILNNKKKGMGFPSHISDNVIMDLLLDNSDHYPYAEERRLFYVAITRAKTKVFFVYNDYDRSIFIDEINGMYEAQIKRENYTCPKCGGRLIKRKGKYGDFFGCSNYSTTGCKFIRNINTGITNSKA